MFKKLAKIKYLPNNFKILEDGDHVICAISGKKIALESLTYWNVDLQEPYYSYLEAAKKGKINNNLFPSVMRPDPLFRIFFYHFL